MATRDDRHNYLIFLLDGGFFMGAMTFVNLQTLLPAMILDQGGPSWLAAMVPSSMILGVFGLPIFTAAWIDSLPRLLPVLALFGGLQRLYYLAAGVLLLIPGFGDKHLIWIASLTPLLAGLTIGVAITAFQRLYIRCIPARMRASNVAYRFLLGGLMGIAAGRVIEELLTAYPPAEAMAYLHFLAFVLMAGSWWFLIRVREPEPEAPAEVPLGKTGLADITDCVKDLFAAGPRRRSMIAFASGLMLMHTFFLPLPFFAKHLQTSINAPIAFLGVLAMWQMIGNASGNLMSAWVGDRFGGRLTMAFGAFCVGLCLLVAPFIGGRVGVCIVYGLFALGVMVLVVGKDALMFDLGPKKRQARFLAVVALLTMVSLLVVSVGSYLLWELTGSFAVLSWTGSAGAFLCFACISNVSEPRTDVHENPLGKLRRGVLRAFR